MYVCRVTGDVQQQCEDWEAALQRYEQARSFYQQQENLSGQAYAYQAMGDVLKARKNSDDLERALQNYKLALPFYGKAADFSGQAYVYHAMADIYRTRNNLKIARRYYELALAQYQVTDNQDGETRVQQAIDKL